MSKFYDMERDGVTQSLVAMWLACREQARLYLEGWDSRYVSPALVFGSIMHGALEQAYLEVQSGKLRSAPSRKTAGEYVDRVEKQWRRENLSPTKDTLEVLEESLALTERIIPIYFDFWSNDFKTKKWLSLEENFNMPVKLESGKVIPVKGKRDGTFQTKSGIWLFETKTKSMVNEGDLMETLSFETQIMLYMKSMWKQSVDGAPPRGTLYNIIRKTALKRKVEEDVVQFADRVEADMLARPDFYFIRIESPVTRQELIDFWKQFASILEEMHLWHTGKLANYKTTGQCINKYGKCKFLPVCSRGEHGGLYKRKTVFKELEEA